MLRFNTNSPFARFERIHIQDGSSFALKANLAGEFPGRFTTISPAAVELHVDLELFSDAVNQVVLSPDSSTERQFCPRRKTWLDACCSLTRLLLSRLFQGA